MVGDWFGYQLEVPGLWLTGPVLGTLAYFYGGWPFLTGAFHELHQRRPGMMLLISMAITVAYTASLATTFGWFDLDFWWELGTLVTVMLLGHWQETKAIGQAQGALSALAALLPDEAELADGSRVPAAELGVGDLVLVRPGGRIPADGIIVEGRAALDESMITGESTPVTRGVDDPVVAGSVATDAVLRVRAVADGGPYAVGGPALLREIGVQAQQEVTDGSAVLHLVALSPQPHAVAAFTLRDDIRPEARDAVQQLRTAGVTTITMITGDARPVAEAVAKELGIDEVFAEVLPSDKDQAVAQLQARGHTVAMVGDGVNDAPALARADVGIAIGAGTDVAIESAGVVLASSDPRGVASVVRLSRASYRKMIQNLAWAAGYNLITLPLAAGVLAWAGVALSPAVGALLMSASTIVVALNAQTLRRVRLMPGV
ncbi:HAD-IC family P-type ATPase [Streptosporangium roseum]|uniref:HAD-IC family P-type ATPase n=1 Tax=Streptosporangium roseum TaxID=2001 RepID=UPI003D9FA719